MDFLKSANWGLLRDYLIFGLFVVMGVLSMYGCVARAAHAERADAGWRMNDGEFVLLNGPGHVRAELNGGPALGVAWGRLSDENLKFEICDLKLAAPQPLGGDL